MSINKYNAFPSLSFRLVSTNSSNNIFSPLFLKKFQIELFAGYIVSYYSIINFFYQPIKQRSRRKQFSSASLCSKLIISSLLSPLHIRRKISNTYSPTVPVLLPTENMLRRQYLCSPSQKFCFHL